MKTYCMRNSKLAGFLGWRFFIGSTRGALISFISTVALLGMSLAVGLLILVLSVMNGFEEEFRQRILSLVPHASLSFQPPLENWKEALLKIQKNPAVSDVQPVIEINAVALRQGKAQPIQLQGVDYSALKERLSTYISSHGETLQRGEVIVGAQLAEKLLLKRGQNLRVLLLDKNDAKGAEGRTKIHSLRLRAILRSNTELDNHIGLISLAEAAAIKEINGVESLQIQVQDVFSAAQIAKQLAQQQSQTVWVSDWSQRYGNLYSAIQLSRQLVGLLLAGVIAVAAFNILVTLGMMVRHKRSDIAILRTIGLSRTAILQAFVAQGMIISSLGCLLGSIFGILAANAAPELAEQLQQWMGFELLQTDIYPINYLPSQVRGQDIFLVCGSALFITLLATLYPAWRAAQIAPAKSLRQGL